MKRKKRLKSDLGQNPKLDQPVSSYWHQFHLLPDNNKDDNCSNSHEENDKCSNSREKNDKWYNSRWFLDSLALLHVFKISLSLWLGWENRNYQKYSGDLYAAFGSQALWLYTNLMLLAVVVQTPLIPVLCRKYFDPNWFVVFECLSVAPSVDLGRHPKLKKFVAMSRRLFRMTKITIELTPWLCTAAVVSINVLREPALDSALLTAFWALLYFKVARPAVGRAFVPFTSFFLFCRFASLRFFVLSTRILSLKSTRIRNPKQSRMMKSRLISLLRDQKRLVGQVRSCNRLYRHVTAVYVPVIAACALATTFGIQKADGLKEKWILAYMMTVSAMVGSAYFVAAGMVSGAVKRCYLAWCSARVDLCACAAQVGFCACAEGQDCHCAGVGQNCNCACAKNQIQSIPLATQLKLLAALEQLSPKKFKIGFTCLHWFALTPNALLKGFFLMSSAYFYLILFAKSLEKLSY